MLALALVEQGRLDEAAEAAESARRRARLDRGVLNLCASIALQRGRPADARDYSERALAVDPHDQRALSDLILAMRQLGDAEAAHRLADLDAIVRLSDVAPPPGFPSVDAFNAALAQAIAASEGLRPARPGTTMRGGRRLADVFALPLPLAEALRATFLAAVADYAAAVDAEHPVTAGRPALPFRLVGWANLVEADDFEQPHIHDAGWLSGVYYVQMPLQGGPILLGGHHHRSLPFAAPAGAVQPRAGQLLLFPSYLHHATQAFTGPGRRVAIAFDVMRD